MTAPTIHLLDRKFQGYTASRKEEKLPKKILELKQQYITNCMHMCVAYQCKSVIKQPGFESVLL